MVPKSADKVAQAPPGDNPAAVGTDTAATNCQRSCPTTSCRTAQQHQRRRPSVSIVVRWDAPTTATDGRWTHDGWRLSRIARTYHLYGLAGNEKR